MQLISEGLFRRKHFRISHCACIGRKNRRACEAKDMVLLKVFDDCGVHITKLTAVALVEDNHDMLLINLVPFVLVHEGGELLDGGNDDPTVVVLKLTLQHRR